MSIRKPVRKITVNVEESKRSFVLEYCVLEKETIVDSVSQNTYGIEVLKQEKTASGTMRIEYRKIFDVFCTEKEAKDACVKLSENTVTPVSLHDIIEQMIGAEEIESEEYEVIAV